MMSRIIEVLLPTMCPPAGPGGFLLSSGASTPSDTTNDTHRIVSCCKDTHGGGRPHTGEDPGPTAAAPVSPAAPGRRWYAGPCRSP